MLYFHLLPCPASRMDHNTFIPSGWSTIFPQDNKSPLMDTLSCGSAVLYWARLYDKRYKDARIGDSNLEMKMGEGSVLAINVLIEDKASEGSIVFVSLCSEESTSFKKGSCSMARMIEDAVWYWACFSEMMARYMVNEAACLWLGGILFERRCITRGKISE